MAHLGEMSRPPLLRVLYVSLAVVAGVLWIWSGFTWWVVAPLVGGSVVAKGVLWWFPDQWEDTANEVALVLVAGLVIVWLLTFTPPVVLGVAVGVGGLVCVAQLRAVLPPWAQWTAVGLSAALGVTCGLVAWLSWRADEERRAADERARHEYTVAELRPDQPLAVLHQVVKAIHDNDPALVCFVFTPEAEREFAEAAGHHRLPNRHHRPTQEDHGQEVRQRHRRPRRGERGPPSHRVRVPHVHRRRPVGVPRAARPRPGYIPAGA